MAVSRESVYKALTVEDNYAKAWSKGKKSVVDGVADHLVSRQHGHPFSYADWMCFADLYLNEAKQGWANYVGDHRVMLVRMLKAASMLIAAIQCHATEEQLQQIAGHSRTEFPISTGGLKQFKSLVGAEDLA